MPRPPSGLVMVVGLGNPASAYGGTRHNVGADFVRRVAAEWEGPGASWRRVEGAPADALVSLALGAVFVVPTNYMNTNGVPVATNPAPACT